MNAAYIWAAMLGWTVVGVLIALVARRGLGQGASEFFIGGRKLRGFVSGMTYSATTYSAFMLVGLVGLTYRSGVGALGFELIYLMFTVLFLVAFGPRFWLVGRRFNHITPPELLSHRYQNKWVAVVAAIISFVMLIPYASVQLMGAGFLVNGLTGGEVPFMAGVLVMALLAGISAVVAGMRSVAWTDAVQALTMLVTAIIALVFVMYSFFGSPAEFAQATAERNPDLLKFTWNPNLFIGLTLPWAFFALTNPQVSQRMYVPDTVVSLRRMVVYFAVFGFIYTVISTLFGYQAALLVPGLENADEAMPRLLATIPNALAIILFVGIFAAASSTLGSIILTLSSLFARDVVRHVRPDVPERSERWIGQIVTVVLLAACIGFAWFRFGLITVLSSMASGGLLVMAPAIIGTFFWRGATAAGALVSMLVAGVVTSALYITGYYPLGWWPSVWGAILSTLLFVVVSLATRPPTGAGEFIDTLETELDEHGFRLLKRRRRAG
ncbi:MAG: sodium:solute symporter family protein [Spirochaetes bacterium]|jgi:SSS family solute:Na+ symporter|nr:sodium:solute symporter family protein [Spirochaetota bacterium]